MSSLGRLWFSGIRNFAPENYETQLIEFIKPVTMIVGQNGCGKTTIIEALRFALLNELPIGFNNGHTFVNDPRIASTLKTKAQIKLELIDNFGTVSTIVKKLESTKSHNNLFITVEFYESTLLRKNSRGVEQSQIILNNSDLQDEISKIFNVNIGLLKYVLLCTQEESLWPFKEGKMIQDIFGEIFQTKEYITFLDQIYEKKKDLVRREQKESINLSYFKNNSHLYLIKKNELEEINLKLKSESDILINLEKQASDAEERLKYDQIQHDRYKILKTENKILKVNYKNILDEIATIKEFIEKKEMLEHLSKRKRKVDLDEVEFRNHLRLSQKRKNNLNDVIMAKTSKKCRYFNEVVKKMEEDIKLCIADKENLCQSNESLLRQDTSILQQIVIFTKLKESKEEDNMMIFKNIEDDLKYTGVYLDKQDNFSQRIDERQMELFKEIGDREKDQKMKAIKLAIIEQHNPHYIISEEGLILKEEILTSTNELEILKIELLKVIGLAKIVPVYDNNKRDIDLFIKNVEELEEKRDPNAKELQITIKALQSKIIEFEILLQTKRAEPDDNNNNNTYIDDSDKDNINNNNNKVCIIQRQNITPKLDIIREYKKKLDSEINVLRTELTGLKSNLPKSLNLKEKEDLSKKYLTLITKNKYTLMDIEENILSKEEIQDLNISRLIEQLNKIKESKEKNEDCASALQLELDNGPLFNADEIYRRKLINIKVFQMTIDELIIVETLIHKGIVSFQKEKMKLLNENLKLLWTKIYKGNDIEYIKIKTLGDGNDDDGQDENSNLFSHRKIYNYSVVMSRLGREFDMRGRCSGGQKVLASLLIRLAIAQTFYLQKCAFFVLDEPTLNLDQGNIDSLAQALLLLIEDLKLSNSLQLILFSQDEYFIEKFMNVDNLDYYYKVIRHKSGYSQIKKKSK